ncbi:NADPH--cytochrome P450 reductase, partial [Penicillium longicatenatum]|uniref:NADPH--cytochrome P450 reductase n=1 Tax=Penicillium longicatenatum TaxID=1561947 RepID=UPI0025480EC6
IPFGTTPFADRGEGDDGSGTQEEDFLAWKSCGTLSRTSCTFTSKKRSLNRIFSVIEKTAAAESIFLGERCQGELMKTSTEYGPQNLRGSGLVYETGDHVAVWHSNSDIEVDRFLRVFGLVEKRLTVIHMSAFDSVKHLPCPSPTTYEAALRYYMEICGPVSRQFLAVLAAFAPDGIQKNTLLELSKNKDTFREEIGSRFLNLAQLIESISPEHPVCPIPFEVPLEGVRALQPRYYSISSSSLVQKDSISLTTAVESVNVAQHDFKGVASNYLLAIKRMQNGEQPNKTESSYTITGPRQKYNISLPIHIRHSSFKLPHDATRPIVMIGPGTGVAPFRAFVQERIKQAESGTEIGDMILFFGCRKEQEDFIHILGDKFQIYTAFSRQTPHEKVYVQQRLAENEKSLRSLVLDHKGYIYICGSGRMAREVQSTLGELLH